jgi:hypothetical protein
VLDLRLAGCCLLQLNAAFSRHINLGQLPVFEDNPGTLYCCADQAIMVFCAQHHKTDMMINAIGTNIVKDTACQRQV